MLEWLREAKAIEPPEAIPEKLRIVGYHGLLARAAEGIKSLKKHGNSGTSVDRIETDLRWAVRIKADLVRSQFPLIVRTLEGSLGRPLEEVRAASLASVLQAAITAAAEAVHGFHAGKGGRLAAPVGLAVTKIGARFVREAGAEPASRARARLGPGNRIPDWTLSLAAWQSTSGRAWLEPHPRIRSGLHALDARARWLLELRYGWGGPARTVMEAAKDVGLPPVRAAAMERRAIGRAAKSGGM